MRTPLLISAFAIAALLGPTSAAAELKLGYVDLQRALNEVEEGKAAKAALKKDFDEKQKELDRKQEELKRMRADLDKQAVVMSEQARREKEEEFQRKAMETQGRFMELRNELARREQEMTKGIFDKMSPIIREIAGAEGFTMVLEKNAAVVFAVPELEVTNELIRKYNAKHKGGAAPAKSDDKAKKPDDKKKKP